MKKRLHYVDLEKYGFVIDTKARKWYTESKKITARRTVAEALVGARQMLLSGYNFKIMEGKRSLNSQRTIIRILEKQFRRKYPKNYIGMLNGFAGGYDSINKPVPMDTHRYGGALDLTIIDNRGRELNMGGTNYDNKCRLNFFEKKRDLTKSEIVIRNNRRLLKNVMIRAGFKPYLPEWWHWKFDE